MIIRRKSHKVIRDRWFVIKNYCKNRTVLDVGCVDHEAIRESKPWWLHKRLKSIAAELVGIDIQEEETKKVKEKGYNIISGDAVTISLDKKFDVIVAGEFMEHISNHGLFLENMHRHLKDDGVLILTTPNLFALRYQLLNFISRKVISNKEHICWFDFYTLKELCERHSFCLQESYYHFDSNTPWYKYIPIRVLTLFRENYAPHILFVLKKCKNSEL